ncbi:CDP-glycerol--glycerophosphate glycerophosphotransferase [Balneolaceae bacterium YR4-1]|uniref:CDP-glycerol--glycerophosphate glycerophosphotransferase n=1 Tax=Halalkalibaculum roseum TaxID=2709311 RepID=A0A6M1SUR1_9BACT|nr:CDP-glycerol glycerophosphotransferase family protein [Halalkalibaculum roseum]NGP76670.1 CDP-glycerol--glycerophosphate glycerophosphotransferase [Halalkalibaculum roseum]
MNSFTKKNLPEFIIDFLRRVRTEFLRPINYVRIKLQPFRHNAFLNKVRNKERIKVAFLVLNIDIWKYENLYFLLKKDERFEPVVVVCPPIYLLDADEIHHQMNKSYEYFLNNGYEVIKTYNNKNGTYLDVKEVISPDIVFFTNPYGYTLKEYQISNFLDVLTCYVQYSFIMEAKEHFYDKTFHSLLWKAFYETDIHKELAGKFAKNKGRNVEVTGHPGTDCFQYQERLENYAWKNTNNELKRIIWAPHWSVRNRGADRTAASNFLELSGFMLDVVKKYESDIQIAFKPHPYLKKTLYQQEGWGRELTESYYNSWKLLPNGQLETGNYVDLFNSSDAMILDSMSFIAEYLFCGKPSLFIKADPEVDKYFNKFGEKALKYHYQGTNKSDIIDFIENVVIKGNDSMKENRDRFYRETLKPPHGKSASQNIYTILCDEIFNNLKREL